MTEEMFGFLEAGGSGGREGDVRKRLQLRRRNYPVNFATTCLFLCAEVKPLCKDNGAALKYECRTNESMSSCRVAEMYSFIHSFIHSFIYFQVRV